MHVVLSGRISELEVELAEKATLLGDTMRTLSTQKATLRDRNKEINLLKLEVCVCLHKYIRVMIDKVLKLVTCCI